MVNYNDAANSYHKYYKNKLKRLKIEEEMQSFPWFNNLTNEAVLDIGCGTGIHLKYLGRKYDGLKSLVGCDSSVEMIKIANQYKDYRAKFTVADMNKLPFEDNYFDIVFSRYSIHYSENLVKTLTEIARVTKRGGYFSFQDSHPFIGVFFKKSKDYFLKETINIPIQKGTVKVTHPTFTIEEYINSALTSGWSLVSLKEKGGNLIKKIDTDLVLPTKLIINLQKIK